jgi:hypothetical protein
MKLPIQFPTDVEIIAEEVAAFRRLSPVNRLRSIRGLIAAGALMMRRSPKSEFLQRHAQEQERIAQQSLKEFLHRHADRT